VYANLPVPGAFLCGKKAHEGVKKKREFSAIITYFAPVLSQKITEIIC
jgi:hypothetical protein